MLQLLLLLEDKMKVRSLLIRGVFASVLLTGCANSEGVLCRLDQEILWILRSANEHGFLNENYYVFYMHLWWSKQLYDKGLLRRA